MNLTDILIDIFDYASQRLREYKDLEDCIFSDGECYDFPSVPIRKETNSIVWHHSLSTFGDAKTIDGWHKERGWAGIGYHFVITKDGIIEKGRKLQLQGAHAKGKNHDSIGVCIIGDFRTEHINEKQLQACGRLFHSLCRSYSKELVNDFHHTDCPGLTFDRDKFESHLNTFV